MIISKSLFQKCYVSNACLAKELGVRHNSIVRVFLRYCYRSIFFRFHSLIPNGKLTTDTPEHLLNFAKLALLLSITYFLENHFKKYNFSSTTGDFGETCTIGISQGKVSKENHPTFSEFHTNAPKSKSSIAFDYGNAMRVLSISDSGMKINHLHPNSCSIPVELTCTPDCTYHPLMMMEYNVKPHSEQ